MKRIVISLGGSIIVPESMNISVLNDFKRTLRSLYGTYKFVVVCGGGVIARKYISVLRQNKKSSFELSKAGIRATRMNARFMMQLFGKEANDVLPVSMKAVGDALQKNKVVFCGALRFAPQSTSDGTAAKLARFLDCDFINITNVKGLFSRNPIVFKNARFISRISFVDFERVAHAHSFSAGQKFVLDQQASTIIKNHSINTYIVGPNMNNFKKLLQNKRFVGTTIGKLT